MLKKIKDNVVSALMYGIGFGIFGILVFPLLLVSLFDSGKLFDWGIRNLCRLILFCVGIRVKLEGMENYDRQKQYICMLNHVNFIDGFVFTSKFPGKARAMEEESHFKWPIYGWLIRRMGMIPVNRQSGRRALIALKEAGELIRNRKGFSICILPEGTRTITGKMGEFKKGGFLIALEAGLDILPVIQIGSFEIQKKTHWLVRPGKIRLVIGKPIAIAGYTRKNIDELITETRSRFLEYVE